MAKTCRSPPAIWGKYRMFCSTKAVYYILQMSHLPAAEVNSVGDSFSFSELRYRRLFEAAHDGILIVDPHTRQIVDANPFLLEFLGYTHAEMIGKELYELGLPQDARASQAAFKELIRKGYVRYENLPLLTKDGRRTEVEFVSNIYQEGDQQIIQCNVRDVGARKNAETALRQSEERFKLAARAVNDVIWDWNLATGSFWWSKNFMSTFGYASTEAEPDQAFWRSRIHADDLGRVTRGIYEAIRSGAESWAAEYRFQYKDGRYASVQDNGFIVRDEVGNGVRMVGGLRDITEFKKAEMQSARTQRMESIGTLAGGIAHDLNNVLTPVMMSIELLKFDPTNDPSRKSILDTIQVSCRRGADLVRQVLNFARGLDGQRVAIRMAQLIEELKGIISESFPRNITIVTQVSEELWPVTGDPTQLQQVLLNLAVNARDAMADGGTLTIRAFNINLDPREIGSARETCAGRHLLLQISDTGSGITADNCEHIFEPFFTTKKIGEGTGFGLAIVHTIVKSHGGFLTVESDVGKGTTFNIYLPADPAVRTIASLPPFHSEVPRGNGELILVVADEFAICDMSKRTLESFGYSVVTAVNGAEAIEIYVRKAREIALVLTDMMMPVMDGATAIQEMKRINPNVKIVAVSGLNIHEATRDSVHKFLAKPYSALELVLLVNEVLHPEVAPL
jgi:PAS domain S-box-containing protein